MEQPYDTEGLDKQWIKHEEGAKTIRVDCDSASYLGGNAFIPVVLADAELQALVESEIRLPTPAREIKSIQRKVAVTQCKAIPSLINRGFFPEVKVFVSGVIHKNIQYVDDYKGYVHDYAVEVPFSCNQSFRVFEAPREFFSRKSTISNERIFIDKMKHGADAHQTGGATYEFYNEPIECKLMFSLVNDLDLYKEVDKHGKFKKVIEKAEVVLFFKLLQNQQTCYLSCDEATSQEQQAETTPTEQAVTNHQNQIPNQSAEERIKGIIKRMEKYNG